MSAVSIISCVVINWQRKDITPSFKFLLPTRQQICMHRTVSYKRKICNISVHAAISRYFAQTVNMNRPEWCMYNRCMGLYGNLNTVPHIFQYKISYSRELFIHGLRLLNSGLINEKIMIIYLCRNKIMETSVDVSTTWKRQNRVVKRFS